MMTTLPVTTVPIQQIFDLAQARSTLRTKIMQQRWPIMFNARASAVITALGELILESRDTRCVVIKIQIISDFDHQGVKLSTSFHVCDEARIHWNARKQNLKIASEDIEIQEAGDRVEITMYVWIN
jgi:hypothetical protein